MVRSLPTSQAQMCSTLSLSLSLFLLLLLQSLSLLTPIHAIFLDVPSGKVKCLTEELRKWTLSFAQYRVVNASAPHLTISARVSNPKGATLHETEGVESGQFSFEVEYTGEHTACFWSPKFELTASLSVDVDWNVGVRTQGPYDTKTNGNPVIEAMGKELKQLEEAIKLIHDEMIFLRDRETDAQRLNAETASMC